MWAQSLSAFDDIVSIVSTKLYPRCKGLSTSIVQFAQWFVETYNTSVSSTISVRDLLAWVTFLNRCDFLDLHSALVQGASLVFIDGLGANPAAMLAIAQESIGK